MKVKICCISSVEEANLAIRYGASAIGLVGKMPSGPGVITDEKIFEIAGSVPKNIDTFLLTSEISPPEIINHHLRTLTNTIQLVDRINVEYYKSLRKSLSNIKLVQVIHVIDESSIDEAVMYSEVADALLLDSGNPNLKIKELGGTGKVHNWKHSRKIVEQSKVPVYLAGGLNPDNVRSAIESVMPYGVDLCSGVRTDCKLDERKLEMYFKNIY
jgi:phosphoribosylanthranilate isomerase